MIWLTQKNPNYTSAARRANNTDVRVSGSCLDLFQQSFVFHGLAS